MSDAGTITPETQIKELTEKLEEETDRLLKLYAAYEQQEAELGIPKQRLKFLRKKSSSVKSKKRALKLY